MSVRQVIQVRDWLIAFLQEHPVFQNYAVDHYSEESERGIGIKLKLVPDTNTYANCFFVEEEDEKTGKPHLVSRVTMIESDVGQATGFFLFHLQCAIAAIVGATEITLENDTDDIKRAREGIYRLFEVNYRGMNKKEKARVQRKNAIHPQKPEMFHIITDTSLADIHTHLLERIKMEVAKASQKVWREDAPSTIDLMFEEMTHMARNMKHGGRRRDMRGRKSRKNRKSMKSRKSRKALVR